MMMRKREIKRAFDQAALKAERAAQKVNDLRNDASRASQSEKDAAREAKVEADKQQAIIHNLYHDDRISPERASKFLAGLDPGWDFENLLKRLEAYHNQYVRRPLNLTIREFSFNVREENGSNFLPADTLAGAHLGSVFNLCNSKLQTLLVTAVSGCGKSLDAISGSNTQIEVQIRNLVSQMNAVDRQKIDAAVQLIRPILNLINEEKDSNPYEVVVSEEIGKIEESDRGAFAVAMLRLIALHNSIVPFEPTWAFCWDELNALTLRYLNQELQTVSAENWCESIAIKAKTGDWMVLLKYPTSLPSAIVRPTQLDAGLHEFHFPSPMPDQPRGGHPVWVAKSVAKEQTHLIREVIHQSVRFEPDHIIAVTKLERDTPSIDESSLINWRQNHWAALHEAYDGIEAWMSNPNLITGAA